MNSTWGIYPVSTNRPRSKSGVGKALPSLRYLVRWRVNAVLRKRSFRQRVHAETFREHLVRACVMGWDADARGWPVDANANRVGVSVSEVLDGGLTFEEYADSWYEV